MFSALQDSLYRPLQTLHLDGTQSSDPDGDDNQLTYEWTILARPQGSTQQLIPAGSTRPRLFLDLAGIYEIELKVYDKDGAVSCGEPAIITVNTIPREDIHVQLVWDTPAGPDQIRAMGPSYATVRIYVEGSLELELENTFMPAQGSFWRVGYVEWSGRTVQSTSQIYNGFPNGQ